MFEFQIEYSVIDHTTFLNQLFVHDNVATNIYANCVNTSHCTLQKQLYFIHT